MNKTNKHNNANNCNKKANKPVANNKDKINKTNENVINTINNCNCYTKLLHYLDYNDVLLHEQVYFERLLYRNKNQHRRGNYYQKLVQIKKIYKKLNLNNIYIKIQHYIDNNYVADKNIHQFIDLLIISCNNMRDLLCIILSASSILLTMLGQSYFMSFALVNLAIIARFYAIYRIIY